MRLERNYASGHCLYMIVRQSRLAQPKKSIHMKTREFVKLSPTFWTGPTGRQLRKAGAEVQLVALYLMSSPHTNYSGLFQLPLNYIANDTGLSLEAVRKALSAIESVGFARYDETSECVWIVEGAKWQLGELKPADKRVAGLQKEFDAVPADCPYKVEFLAKHGKALCLSSKAAKAQAPKQAELVPVAPPAATQATEPSEPAEPAQDEPAEVRFIKPGDDARYEHSFNEYYSALADRRADTGLSTKIGDKEHAAAFLKIAAAHGYALAANVANSCIVLNDLGTANLPARVREALSHDIDEI